MVLSRMTDWGVSIMKIVIEKRPPNKQGKNPFD